MRTDAELCILVNVLSGSSEWSYHWHETRRTMVCPRAGLLCWLELRCCSRKDRQDGFSDVELRAVRERILHFPSVQLDRSFGNYSEKATQQITRLGPGSLPETRRMIEHDRPGMWVMAHVFRAVHRITARVKDGPAKGLGLESESYNS